MNFNFCSLAQVLTKFRCDYSQKCGKTIERKSVKNEKSEKLWKNDQFLWKNDQFIHKSVEKRSNPVE